MPGALSGSQIVKPYQGDKGGLQAITLDPRLEQQIAQGVRQTPTEISLMMEPKLARHVVDTLSQTNATIVDRRPAAGRHVRAANPPGLPAFL